MTDEQERDIDAKLVQEYHQRSLKRAKGISERMAVQKDREHYRQAQEWFMAKWHVPWMICIKEEPEHGI